MPKLSPVAMFVYNRPDHFRRTLEALARNPEATSTALWIFSDGHRIAADASRVDAVRQIAHMANGFGDVRVVERRENLGLSRSIVSGVGQLCSEFGQVIVLEDDLVVSTGFLRYMNDALEQYRHEARVAAIGGYMFPTSGTLPETFFFRVTDCWGWATWQRAWQHYESDGSKLLREIESKGLTRDFDLDGAYRYTSMLRQQIRGRNDSWAVRWYATAFLKGMLTLYPGRSLVRNIGRDGSGVHGETRNHADIGPCIEAVNVRPVPVIEDQQAYAAICSYLQVHERQSWRGLMSRLKSRLSGARWR